ncbi:MAG: peptidoglycan editing factor PgeF [Alphaproteobacteria bacterium]|nr:peptidoglycan editing factor PgeF [Alphaproteobacteria bacterium]
MKITDKIFGRATPSVKHGFFGCLGGVSTGGFESLNCGLGTDDDPDSVQENRMRVAGALGVSPENLITVKQIHSAKCVRVTQNFAPDQRPEADALVTDCSGLALGVLTADCGPVLFYGEKADGAPVIGAAHSGWRGALGGVNEATIEAMVDLGAEQETIRAVIGPCIAQASYEVPQDFARGFIERNAEDERFFKFARKENHLMFDLPGYIAGRLARAGLKQVSIMGHNTYKDRDVNGEYLFFSHRRATHEGYAENNGRQISAIAILEGK